MPFDNPKPREDSVTVKHLKQSWARLSRPYGWCKGSAFRTVSKYQPYLAFCTQGAITLDDTGRHVSSVQGERGRDANAYHFVNCAAYLLSNNTKSLSYANNHDHVVDFNDYRSRTIHDIELLFDVAIELAERHEAKLPI